MKVYILLLNGKIQAVFESKSDAQAYADDRREDEIGSWTYVEKEVIPFKGN